MWRDGKDLKVARGCGNLEVARGEDVDGFKGIQKDFEPESVMYQEPVKLLQNRQDLVVVKRSSGKDPGG